jgi:membrane dipeptidase
MEEMDMERALKKKYNDDKTLYEPELKRWKASHKYARGSIHDLLDHIDHIAKVAGPEYIGLGSDFDGVSLLPRQLEDASCYPYITQGLIDRGYTDEQIKGILGGNLLRVMRGVEAYAAKHRNEGASQSPAAGK